jgi:hypothetical protein
MASEDTENFVSAVVRSRMNELFVVTIYKCPINPITNSDPMSSY